VREHPTTVLDCRLELVALTESRFLSQPLDFAVHFPSRPSLEANVALFSFEGDLRFA
jgi:hypothetical protein